MLQKDAFSSASASTDDTFNPVHASNAHATGGGGQTSFAAGAGAVENPISTIFGWFQSTENGAQTGAKTETELVDVGAKGVEGGKEVRDKENS